MEQNIGRIPPHDSNAEKSLIGAILLSSKTPVHVMSAITHDDFYLLAHQRIYEAFEAIAARKGNIDLITVSAQLGNDGALDAVGGFQYLAEISEFVPGIANMKQYADIVSELSRLRKLIEAGGQMIEQCFEQAPSDEISENARKTIRDIDTSDSRSNSKHVSVFLEQALSNIESANNPKNRDTRLKSCFPDIDNFVPRLGKGQVTVVAATPGSGKSAFALNVVDRICTQLPDMRVSLLSYEMQGDELAERQIAIRGHVNAERMQKGQLFDDEMERVVTAIDHIAKFNLHICDRPPLTLNGIAKLIHEESPDLLIIDYLQLMSIGHKTESEHLKISEITRTLKIMSADYGIHIMLLSQLNRNLSTRGNKRPILADLRGSGSIEENADNVFFIHREDVYRHNQADYDGKAEVIVSKHRAGKTGTAYMKFNGSLYLFVDSLEGR